MSDKSAPKIISKTGYNGVAYCHQGWVLDRNNQAWMIMDDEYDEMTGRGPAPAKRPTTYIWNITSLEHPVNTGFFKGTVASVDHNQYIYNGLSYQSNYGSGLRVVDVRSIPTDPTGKSVREIGFFDIYPNDDNQPDGMGRRYKFVQAAGFQLLELPQRVHLRQHDRARRVCGEDQGHAGVSWTKGLTTECYGRRPRRGSEGRVALIS